MGTPPFPKAPRRPSEPNRLYQRLDEAIGKALPAHERQGFGETGPGTPKGEGKGPVTGTSLQVVNLPFPVRIPDCLKGIFWWNRTGTKKKEMEDTTFHVRQAQSGDQESLSWVVAHLTPLLMMQARYRLQGTLRQIYDPEDLVQDVWAACLPRLPSIQAQQEDFALVLIKYLSKALLNRVNKILRTHLRGRMIQRNQSLKTGTGNSSPLSRIMDETTGIPTRLDHLDRQKKIQECIASLPLQDQEILVLRGIEQVSNQQVGKALGLNPSAISMRYRRALDRLRSALPPTLLAELKEAVGKGE